MTGTAATTTELQRLAAELDAARKPEQIFGAADEAKHNYLRLVRAAHPDKHPADTVLAEAVMAKLNGLWQIAERSISAGSYGTRRSVSANPLRIRSRRAAYTLGEQWRTDDIANWYDATSNAGPRTIRIARQPRDNDLLGNEATILKHLYANTEDNPGYRAYLPTMTDSFTVRSGGVNRRANAFASMDGLWSLQAVIDAYPQGVHAKDAAWIFRRLLVAVGYAHSGGVVHGALVPSNILIHPEQHGLVLANWSYARSDGGPLTAVVSRWRDIYPEEVLAKEPAVAETDIYMAAMTMIRVLGGHDRALPLTVPRTLRAFFKGCTLQRASRRPDDAWLLKDTFDEVLEQTYGPRRFHPFAMPATAREA